MSRRSRVQASHGAHVGQVPEWFKGLVLSTNARKSAWVRTPPWSGHGQPVVRAPSGGDAKREASLMEAIGGMAEAGSTPALPAE